MADVELHWDWPPLSDDALVVRGGPMDSEHLYLSAATVERETAGVWGLCVGAADGSTAYQIARTMPYRGKRMRVTSLGPLRAAGFDVVMVDEPPHAVLLLNGAPEDAAWEGWDRLRRLFTEPMDIPR